MGKFIACKPKKRDVRCVRMSHSTIAHVYWKKSLPFNVNPRGVLVHRVRLGQSITYHGKRTHDCVDYWCGNGAHSEGVSLTDSPPDDRLLCEACERIAVANGEPSSDELCGRHVHIGVLRAHRTCCRNDDN